MDEVLLGLVGVEPDRVAQGFRPRRWIPLRRHGDDQALQRVEPAPGVPPLLFVVPGEGGPQRLGRPPAVGEAEAGEQAARAGLAEGFDQELAQQAEGEGVEQQRPFAGEAQGAAAGFEAEQLPEVEIACSHCGLVVPPTRSGRSAGGTRRGRT